MIYHNLLFIILSFILILIWVISCWPRLNKIYHSHPSFFDLLFILLYPFEEIIFLFLYYLEPQLRDLWVALILLSIFSTVAVDKWLLKKQNMRAMLLHAERLDKYSLEYEFMIKDLNKDIKLLDGEKRVLLKYIHKELQKNSS